MQEIVDSMLEADSELIEQSSMNPTDYIQNLIYMFGSEYKIKATIKSTISAPKGKYPYTMGFVALMDYSQFPITDYA